MKLMTKCCCYEQLSFSIELGRCVSPAVEMKLLRRSLPSHHQSHNQKQRFLCALSEHGDQDTDKLLRSKTATTYRSEER
jgi:hypothetical protein